VAIESSPKLTAWFRLAIGISDGFSGE